MQLTEHFTSEDFVCHHCGAAGIKQELVELLEKVRQEIGVPIYPTSGYRCPKHQDEIKKKAPGQHVRGVAADITAPGVSQFALFQAIRRHPEFHGIGVSKGSFIHVDLRPGPLVFWKYLNGKDVRWDGVWETL